MDTKAELEKSYEGPEFRKWAPLPFTRYRNYFLVALVAGISLLVGFPSNYAMGFAFLTAAIIVGAHAVLVGGWNAGVRKYGAEKWIKYVQESLDKKDKSGVE